MKRILFTLLILSSLSMVRAQSAKSSSGINSEKSNNESDLKLGLSINPGVSLGKYGQNFVLGGELGLYKNLTSNLEGIFSAGFTQFFYSNNIKEGGLIPVKAGVRYSLKPRLYVGAQVGAAFSITDGGAYLIYSPTVGWKINKHFDIGLKYDHFSNEPGVVGLNLTYKFGR